MGIIGDLNIALPGKNIKQTTACQGAQIIRSGCERLAHQCSARMARRECAFNRFPDAFIESKTTTIVEAVRFSTRRR